MKILYVKSNNEREKKYQIQTIIFEKNGEKFVKKKALCKEAIPHLMHMKESYDSLSASIVDSNVHLAKIIEEENDSLTFEFIDGISMEKKILDALKGGKQESVNHIIDSYIELLNTGFKTIKTTSQNILTPEGKRIFQDLDFADLGDTLCFDEISNVDLIFSNIIYRDNKIYLIDYEWVFKGALPLNYSLFRAFRSLHDMDKLGTENYFTDSEFTLFNAMERRLFLFEVAGADSFYQYQEKFGKVRSNLYHRKLELEHDVSNLTSDVANLTSEVSRLEDRIKEMQDEILYYALSKSWKITRPMRKIFTHLRGLK